MDPTSKPPDEAPPAPAPADAAEEGKAGPPGPPVAGIGASAGGLDAFKKFFAAMPAGSGIAFVLIPHLDPKHESLMVELIARHTSMPVVEAADGMAVEASRVHIIPPNKYMTISDGVLRLSGPVERTGPQTSIDLFLRSLADAKQEKAICIILSGTGSHGTWGLKAIKAAGGLAVVQDPETADYPLMPRSAVATGLVDYVLPVEKMPEAIIQYVQQSYVNGAKTGAEETDGPDHLNQLLALIRARTKLDFRAYRKKMLARRVERRMSQNHFGGIADYLAHLREHPDEVKQLSRDLLIGVTSFFRDPEAWGVVEKQVIAPLVRAKEPDAPVRVWSVGCATGEEPYSLGMLLLEQLAAAQKHCPVQIFASDVDEDSLEVARRAIYPESISADVSPERLGRFFTRVSVSTHQVSKQLREVVTFARQNLLTDAPFSKLDLVVCRNLLIYLEPEVQKTVISLLHFALSDGGVLFLGSSETIGRNVDLFEPVSGKWRIYRRIGPARANDLHFPAMQLEPRQAKPQPVARPQPAPRLAELAQNFLLRRFALACVVINRSYEVLHFAGPTEGYLIQPAGPPTHGLLSLARSGLESKLRVVIHRAIKENAPQGIKDVMMQHAGVTRRVNIDVEPLNLGRQTEGLLLVAFQEQPLPEGETLAEAKARTQTADADMLRQLEQELETTREDLQSTIEELESSNEELKASNEEIMSMNEELQSTNEELETSWEELQSLNEELGTVNNQLQDKVQDLETANNDIANFLDCTDVATVFLDPVFRIRRYTPTTTQLFNLIATDIGRSLGDIAKKFTDDDLLRDAQQVLRDLKPHEKEVQTENGQWFARRIVPYRSLDNRIDGVAMTFVDITELKQAADAVVRRLASIVETSADAIISRDLDGTIRTWNRGAERLYGYTREEAVGQPLRLTVPEDRIEEWASIVERLRRDEHVEQFESERVRKDGRRVLVEMTVSPLRDSDGRVVSASVVARDVSERKRAEGALRESEQKFRHMADAAPVLIWLSGPDKLCTWFNKPWLDFVGRPMEQELGNGWAENVHPDDYDRCLKTYVASFDAREPFRMEYQLRRHDGEYRWVLDTGIPLLGVGGEFAGYIGTCVDITDRKRSEEVLREREMRLRRMMENAHVGIAFCDSEGRIVEANQTILELVGWSEDDLHAGRLNCRTLCRPEDHEQDRRAMTQLATVGRVGPAEKILIRSDGAKIPVLISAFRLDANRDENVTFVVDLTPQKQAEGALRASEARLRAILETSVDAVITIDHHGVIQSVNPATERMFGYTAAETIGQNVSMLMASPHREAHDGYIGNYLRTGENHILDTTREVNARRKDGSVFPTDLTVSEIKHLKLFTGTHRDLTRRKELEREVVEIASEEQQRIGRELHDVIGQELTGLGMLADALARQPEGAAAARSQLAGKVAAGLQRVHEQVRTLCRDLVLTNLDGEGLRTALANLAERTRDQTGVECSLDCPTPVVVPDPTTTQHLYRIAQEAVSNAIRHGKPEHVRIELHAIPHGVRLCVEDDGSGLPNGGGYSWESRGLGLSTMRYRANLIGGSLHVTPADGKGVRVVCIVPREDDDGEG